MAEEKALTLEERLKFVLGNMNKHDDLNQIQEGHKKDVSNGKYAEDYVKLVLSGVPTTEERFKKLIATTQKFSPMEFGAEMGKTRKGIETDVTQLMAESYLPFVQGINGPYLMEMAWNLSGNAKREELYAAAIKVKDLAPVKKDIVSLVSDKYRDFKRLLATCLEKDDGLAVYWAQETIKDIQSEFYGQFLKDGTKEGEQPEIDESKIRSYLTDLPNATEEKARPKLYFEAANSLYKTHVKVEEAKKKAEEEKKKAKPKK